MIRISINYSLFILFLFIGCNNICETDIDKLITSKSAKNVVKGYYIIGECNLESYVKQIFENIDDSRISHEYKFYGISVYQSKVIALKKISGLNPPNKITNEVDKTVVEFYLNWAKKKSLLPDFHD